MSLPAQTDAGLNDCRVVFRHANGWAERAAGADRPESIHHTQNAAVSAALLKLRECGGGELEVLRADGGLKKRLTVTGSEQQLLEEWADNMRWRRRAAEQGHAAAQFAVGKMHEHGQSVPPDLVLAYRWYYLAAQQGNPEAAAACTRIAEDMPPEDIEEARRMPRLWQTCRACNGAGRTGNNERSCRRNGE